MDVVLPPLPVERVGHRKRAMSVCAAPPPSTTPPPPHPLLGSSPPAPALGAGQQASQICQADVFVHAHLAMAPAVGVTLREPLRDRRCDLRLLAEAVEQVCP